MVSAYPSQHFFGYRCGVGRTAKKFQIIPADFWLDIIITLYIQKQNIKFVKILRSFCRDYRTPTGRIDCQRGENSKTPLLHILYSTLLGVTLVAQSAIFQICLICLTSLHYLRRQFQRYLYLTMKIVEICVSNFHRYDRT
jgi:hypothetical protein